METALKEAQGLLAAIGTYARLTIVGVWFPGFLMFCELGYVLLRASGFGSNPLALIRAQINQLDSNFILAIVLILLVSTSILLGYIARDIAFALSDFWIRKMIPPARSLREILSQTKVAFGTQKVDDVVSKYPVFELADRTDAERSLPRSTEAYVREFCKRWLSAKVPDLNTSGMEVEINMVIGLVTPLGLLALVLYLLVGGTLGLSLAALALLAYVFMMYRITWARNTETEQAISNFLFAHWENLAAAKDTGTADIERELMSEEHAPPAKPPA